MMKHTYLLSLFLNHVLLSLEICLKPGLPRYAESVYQLLDKYSENHKFYYKCVDGYQFEHDNEPQHKVACKNGTWIPNFVDCVDNCQNKCVHGTCAVSSEDTDGNLVYGCSCDENYVRKYCDIRVCPLLGVLPHGSIKPSSPLSRAIGRRVQFRCDPGYHIDGYSSATCENNGWSHPLPTCKVSTCSRPDKIDVKLEYRPMSITYDNNRVITFTCEDNYIRVGQPFVSCTNSGTWSADWPTCRKPVCPTPPRVANAYRETNRDYYIGDKVTYSCMQNYVMDENQEESLKCLDSLTWYGVPPKCSSLSEFKRNCESGNQVVVQTRGRYSCAKKTYTHMTQVSSETVKSSAKPLTIVTATAGALLLLLLIVISVVACQRRRMSRNHRRHGRARMNSTDDRFSFVYYSNDVHVVLPSYDEAMQARTLQPPPYVGDADVDPLPVPARRYALDILEQNGVREAENEYETIEDVTTQPQEEEEAPAASTTTPVTNDEPIYASIQRVSSGGARKASEEKVITSENELVENVVKEECDSAEGLRESGNLVFDASDTTPLIDE